MEHKWIVKEQDNEKVSEICSFSGLPEIAVRVLINYGLTGKREISSYLNINPAFLHSPFLFEGMEKAVVRIKKAVFDGEKIAVYGDYDVDGVTSVALIYLYLGGKGADITYYIPDRADEGYGLNIGAIDRLFEKGIKLLITVDSGITAAEEIAYAKEKGIDVIVTDHHECKDILPDCVAVINPKLKNTKYPYPGLAGVGVAFKLVCAVEGEENTNTLLNNYVDLVALGTIADVMPLTDENRIFVSIGLSKFNKRQIRMGLRTLLYTAGIDKNKTVSASTIGFSIAPKINAAGRLGNAGSAVDLLIEDESDKALRLAEHLCSENVKRQETENDILNEALSLFESTVDTQKDKIAVLYKEGWHHGIIGIVASRITDKMNMPIILISLKDGKGKGSGRSIKGFNLYEALSCSEDLLLRYGGHELAAGLTIDEGRINDFVKRIKSYCNEKISDELRIPSLYAVCEVNIDTLTIEEVLTLKRFEPFGVSNAVPLFYSQSLIIIRIMSLSEGKHTKIMLKSENTVITALWFCANFSDFPFSEGHKVDIMYQVDISEYKGYKKIQLIIKDMRQGR